MKQPPAEFPSRDPEARLTALLLGELAPEETAALRKEIRSDPALRELYDRLATTVGLLREHFAPANGAAPARLPTEQRRQLLATLQQPAAPSETVTPLPVPGTPWWQVAVPLGLAATLTLLLAGVVFAPRFLEAHRPLAFAADSSFTPAETAGLSGPNAPGEEPEALRHPSEQKTSENTVRGLAVVDQAGRGARPTAGASFGIPSAASKQVNGPVATQPRSSSGARSRSQTAPQVDFYYLGGSDDGRVTEDAPTTAPNSGALVADGFALTTRGEAVREHAESAEDVTAAIAPPTGPTVGFIMDNQQAQGDESRKDRTLLRGYAEHPGGPGGGGGGGFGGGMGGGGEGAYAGFGGGGIGVAGKASRDFASGLAGETAQAETRAATEWGFGRSAGQAETYRRAPDAAGAPVVGEALTELARDNGRVVMDTDGGIGRFQNSGNGVVPDARIPQGGRGAEVETLDDGIVAGGRERLGRLAAPTTPPPPGRPKSGPAPVAAATRPVPPPTARFSPPPPAAKPQRPAAPAKPSSATGGSLFESDRSGLLAGKAPETASRSDTDAKPAKPAEPMDRLMMERYGLLPADEAGDENGHGVLGAESGAIGVLDAELDLAEASAPTPTTGRARGRTQTRSSGQNRAWFKAAAPTTATAVPEGEPQPKAGAQADASRMTALGDRPEVGQMFGATAGKAGGSTDGKKADSEEEELAPLPLKLPVPAFMGTPTDMSLAPAPSPASRRESRSRSLATRAPTTPAPKQRTVFAGTTVQGLGEPAAAEHEGRLSQALPELQVANELAKIEAVDKLAAAAESNKRLSEGKAKSNLALRKRASSSLQSEVRQLKEAEKQPEQPRLAAAEGLQQLRRPELAAKRAKAEAAKLQDLAKKVPTAAPAEPLPEILTTDNPFSTFSLNVADVSFKLAAAALAQGRMPEAGRIRSEEFVNAFDYRDPAPAQRVGFVWERARFPFAHNREVLRFSLKTAALGREANRPLNLVLLLDSSGSMERADRVRIVRNALSVLGRQLRPHDRLSVVTFSSQANLRADGVQGPAALKALQRATEVPPEGGTNLEDAMKLAYATAERHLLANGINRVVVLTDGAANLGDVSPERLQNLVESNRRKGIAFDAFGVGWEGYNDDLLEVLTRHGDGRYGFMNTPEEAATGFAQQLAGALQVAAADVKVQVEFNPSRVLRYRQVGFRQHRLTKEQFRDNTVDAAEIGAAEAGNALYIIETKPDGQGPIGHLRARYRVPTTGAYEEREWLLDYRGPARPLASAPPTLRLATTAATFAEWLAGSPYAGGVKLDELLRLIRDVPALYPRDPRPAQLRQMIEQARSIQGL